MAEADDNLERLDAVVNEIEAHYQRLLGEAKLARATSASLMQEMSETVMPLLKDFSVRMFAELIAVRQYIHQHVEPALQRAGDDPDDSVLLLDDSGIITARLLAYRELLEGMLARAAGDDKAKLDGEMAEVDKVLARVAEITIDDEADPAADPDDDEPDLEDDDDDDESPGAGAN